MENIICPSCRLPAQSETFCQHCHIYNTEQTVQEPPLSIPNFKTDLQRADVFHLVHRWLKIWDIGFLIATSSVAIIMGLVTLLGIILDGQIDLKMTVFFVVSAYVTAVGLVNRTRLTLRPEEIEISRGPLFIPFCRSFVLRRSDIKRFELSKLTVPKKRGGSSISFHLELITEPKERSFSLLKFKSETEAVSLYKYLFGRYSIATKFEKVSEQQTAQFFDSKAYHLSKIYTFGYMGGLMFNVIILPIIFFIEERKPEFYVWKFDVYFWTMMAIVAGLFFLIFYFHHRKHLDFRTSRPIAKDAKPGGILGYLAVSMAFSLFFIPVVMTLYNLILILNA